MTTKKAPRTSRSTRSALSVPAFTAARLRLMFDKPYYGPALFAVIPVEVEGLDTFAVDQHWRLYMGSRPLAEWSVEQVATVLEHEINHLLRDHAGRSEPFRDRPEAWNMATDAEINDDLRDLPFPLTPVTPDVFGAPDNLLAEQYMEYVPQPSCPSCGQQDQDQQHDQGQGGGTCQHGAHHDCGSGADGITREWDIDPDGTNRNGNQTNTPIVDAASAQVIRRSVAEQIVQHAKQRGTAPSGLVRWAEGFLTPRYDWRKSFPAVCRSRINALKAGSADYSWRRPSRRTPPGLMLPGGVTVKPRIAAVIDTSGSMSDRMISQAWTEVKSILRNAGYHPKEIEVFACDAAAEKIDLGSGFGRVELVGGGGTDMGVGIRAAMESRHKPDLLIVLTDCFTPWPAEPPRGVKVVVGAITRNGYHGKTPDWAETVIIPAD